MISQHEAFHYANEIILSLHTRDQWRRRVLEREKWMTYSKHLKSPKQLIPFLDSLVDVELYPALVSLNHAGIQTEYSCAGVSLRDDPLNHSLYAYITLPKTKQSTHFVETLMSEMKHRMLVTFESDRNRYDLSSFYIQHNRSFCLLINHYAKKLTKAGN